MTDDLIGKTLGGYEILDRVGQGGMATVYRARQTSMNRTVALKVLPRHFMRDDTYLQRFEREVKIVSQLEHRNIVPVHDYGESEGQPYIAMRYMPAGSVDDLLKQGVMPPEKILSIIKQIAPALDYAHGKNVLHRDLKPSNILMDDDGGAYITDFGIARIVGVEGEGHTITTQGVVGTPSYMSPEQAQGKELDGRSDVYSLGVMLFEMSTGRRPFENDTPYGIAVMQVTTPPPVPRTINPEISAGLEQVIVKSLKKNPDNRYQTATELAQELEVAILHPEKLHDTQPHPLPIKEALQQTQPSFVEKKTTPSSGQALSPAPVAAVRTPPPSSYSGRPVSQQLPPPGFRSRVKKMRRTRPSNFWISMAIGGLLGCAMLMVIVVVLGMIASMLISTDDPSATPQGGGGLPTLDDVSEAARLTMVGPGVPGSDLTTQVYTNATPITRATATEIMPISVNPSATFEPDFVPSQIVYFAYRDDNYNIYMYDMLTGVEVPLTDDDTSSSYPAISPDGTKMLFQSNRDGDFEIYVMDLSTRNITQLTNNTVSDRIASWSPDGQWIYYSSDTRVDGNHDIYRVPSTGGESELVFSNGLRNAHPRLSLDGRSMVFTTGDSTVASTWEIIRMDLATGETLQLTSNDTRDASPSFTPDSNRIIYNPYGEGLSSISTIDLTGSELPSVLYDGEGYEWGMDFSADGEWLVFNSEVDDVSTIFVMRADGTGLREIEGIDGFYPAWVQQR